jgi:hypothetical protein
MGIPRWGKERGNSPGYALTVLGIVGEGDVFGDDASVRERINRAQLAGIRKVWERIIIALCDSGLRLMHLLVRFLARSRSMSTLA